MFSWHFQLGGDVEQTQNTPEGLPISTGRGTPWDLPRRTLRGCGCGKGTLCIGFCHHDLDLDEVDWPIGASAVIWVLKAKLSIFPVYIPTLRCGLDFWLMKWNEFGVAAAPSC